jgi:PRTRC genetic system protein C
MQVLDLLRKFQYNSITLPDPHPALTPEQIKEVFAAQYPELTNSVVEGPVTKDGTATYKFTRAVGSKGAQTAPADQVLQAVLSGRGVPGVQAMLCADGNQEGVARLLAGVALERRITAPMQLPSEAFGLWG